MLASGLAEKGIVIVSGLALGVDALAHKACLDAGTPTISVLPCGINALYPRTNTNLGKQIEHNGCLISENTGDYNPHEYDFLIRNRLISGLSDGVIVTQAAARSGSLNTARHALEQGRVVMTVPGPITNPLCEGPNNLLKMGATPVTGVEDVLKALNIIDAVGTTKDYELLAQNEQELVIIKLLQGGASDGELIALQAGMSAQEFNVHLTMLEIRGVISPLGANHWTLG
jgi:DNA processing protein